MPCAAAAASNQNRCLSAVSVCGPRVHIHEGNTNLHVNLQVLSTLNHDLAVRLIRVALLPHHHSGRHPLPSSTTGVAYPDGLFHLPRHLWTKVIHAWWPCIDADGVFAVTVAARLRLGALPAAHAVMRFHALRQLTLDCRHLDSETFISLPWEFENVALAACRLPHLSSLHVILGTSRKFASKFAANLPEASGLTALSLQIPGDPVAHELLPAMPALELGSMQLTRLKTLELRGRGTLPGAQLRKHLTQLCDLRTLALAVRMPTGNLMGLMHAASELPHLASVTLDHCVVPPTCSPFTTSRPTASVHVDADVAKGVQGGTHAPPPPTPPEPYMGLAIAIGRISGLREFVLHEGAATEAAGGRLPPTFMHELCHHLAAGCRGLTRLELVDAAERRDGAQHRGLLQSAAYDAEAVGLLLEASKELQELRLEGISLDEPGTDYPTCTQ